MNPRTVRNVGIIGLGKMGHPIARHLGAKGFAVAGYDVATVALERAQALGVRAAASPAALTAMSDLVIVLPALESQVEEVLFGPRGVLECLERGKIIAVGSTISPRAMRDFGERLEKAGMAALDIPICRGEPAAEAGRLLIVGGGDAQVFELCRPAFSAFSDSIHRIGPLGSGQVGKMVNNLVLWACISANYEGLKIGEVLGVDREAMRTMLLDSSAQNWALQTRIADLPMPWAEKDMMIVLAEADAARMSLPLCGVVKEVIKGIKVERGE